MLAEIEIRGFKSFETVRLRLGKLNLFVGANASGKSNFLEALRVLQGLGYGFTVDEIFNGKPKTATSEVWDPVRGGTARALFFGRVKAKNAKKIHFSATLDTEGEDSLLYSVDISPRKGEIISENLQIGSELLYETSRNRHPARAFYRDNGLMREMSVDRQRPTLHQLLEASHLADRHQEVVRHTVRALSNLQRIDPSLDLLRDYSLSHFARRMGEHGENFAAVIQKILDKPELKQAYVSWLQHLTPMEVADVVVLKGAVEESLFAIKEGRSTVPAQILSDGMLRFAAIAAAFFQPDTPDILMIEDIESGIHPSSLRLLVELLKSQSKRGGPQVFATTHSPVVLAWLDEVDYGTTFFCKRDGESGASVIKPLSEIPHLAELANKYSVGELFTQGWMETAL